MIESAKFSELQKLSKEALLSMIQEMRKQSTAIHIEKDQMKYDHPTQKPVGIMTPLIKNSSAVEEIVVDIFAGSGSTLMAAHQLDRVCYAMEFSPNFCDVMRKRYAKAVGNLDQWQEITPALDN